MGNYPGLDPHQVRDYVVRPALHHLRLPGGEVAERLVMGTAAHESQFRYLHQAGGGPALGLWQMEPATFRDLWRRLASNTPAGIKLAELAATAPQPVELQLATNLMLGAAMCRVHYYLRPFAMPSHATVDDLAAIWKEHYNTRLGKGKPEQFVKHYQELVAPLYPPTPV